MVGSLLRPLYLVEARRQLEAGVLKPSEFKRIEDRAVDEAIALQEAAGLDVLTDGELRRYTFYGHFIDSFDGFEKSGGWATSFRNEQGEQEILQRPAVVEKLRWRRNLCAEEFTYLRARTRRSVKVTLIGAQNATAFYDPEKSRSAYPTLDAYLADVVDVLRCEVTELGRLGCTYIQIDGPHYSAALDPTFREGYRRRGIDLDHLMDRSIELDNAVIAGHPAVTFALHICRGNYKSKFVATGGYDPIAERIFRRTRFQRFLLEYDDERSGSFEPLRLVPEDRTIVLGLVTTKKPQLESMDDLRRRIEEAARIVPLERLALSPQCGFASDMVGNLISPEDQEKKLRLVAETARAVWGA